MVQALAMQMRLWHMIDAVLAGTRPATRAKVSRPWHSELLSLLDGDEPGGEVAARRNDHLHGDIAAIVAAFSALIMALPAWRSVGRASARARSWRRWRSRATRSKTRSRV